ncbi:MAG: GNAT family N-acetyltransferase [Xenococcaceae cyanobacterium MO_207.B15]|nr:GNAT family N-acetyltransferase [Xenococcaceae cyanobacterium MO_207.B15]
MTLSVPKTPKITIRPMQYRDLEPVKALMERCSDQETSQRLITIDRELKQVGSWYGLRKFLSLLPYSSQEDRRIYVAEQKQEILGLIQVSPFNSTRTTWRVERVLLSENNHQLDSVVSQKKIGSQLLRHCLENIWEARTWILEVNVNDKHHLALYRENGFQPLAQMIYWRITSKQIAELAKEESNLPNLLPVSNADAPLLYQLDCVSMPPLLRQIFDRHIQDFKSNFLQTAISKIRQWLEQKEIFRGYVFEPQRKAAIGYFRLEFAKDGSRPHQAQLTVNPAYTWLYPQLIAQMSQIANQKQSAVASSLAKNQGLELVSADYQPEREEYLTKIGASPTENTLLMSRSVWHKIRETKPLEGLQLSEVLQGLKPAQTPIPSRISWLQSLSNSYQQQSKKEFFPTPREDNYNSSEEKSAESSKPPNHGHHA